MLLSVHKKVAHQIQKLKIMDKFLDKETYSHTKTPKTFYLMVMFSFLLFLFIGYYRKIRDLQHHVGNFQKIKYLHVRIAH